MNELERIIRERVHRQGKITFAEFMEMALYYPGLGYYTSGKSRVGADGDFFTSPATHPVFAALITLQLEQMWHMLGNPGDFTVVEMGAGKGLLARDIVSYAENFLPDFSKALRYVARERSVVSVVKGEKLASSPQVAGCVLSNELLDALPTHLVMMENGRLREIYVSLDDDRFVEVTDVPSSSQLEARLNAEGTVIPEGCRTEINLDIERWMADVDSTLERGYVLIIDYGYAARELYAPGRSRGTLMTYYRHTPAESPYIRIGEQDITSHVDFTTASLAGEKRGWNTLTLISQRQFLVNLGFNVFLEAIARRGLGYQEYLANRYSMLELVRREGMGDFRVLIQSKGMADVPLYATQSDSDLKDRLQRNMGTIKVPLLTSEHIGLLSGKYPDEGQYPVDSFH